MNGKTELTPREAYDAAVEKATVTYDAAITAARTATNVAIAIAWETYLKAVKVHSVYETGIEK